MINERFNLNKLLGLLIAGSVFTVLVGLAAYISPIWIKLSIPGGSGGQGIAFSYVSAPLLFHYGANDFSDLPTEFKVAEIFFPFALIGVIISIIRIEQSRRFLKRNPSGLNYVRRVQYQSFGLQLAALALLVISLSTFTSKTVKDLNEADVDSGKLFQQLGSSISNIKNSGNSLIPSTNTHLNTPNNLLPSGNSPFPSNNNPFPSNSNLFSSNNNPLSSYYNPLPSDNSDFAAGNIPFPLDNNHFAPGNYTFSLDNNDFASGNNPFPLDNNNFASGNYTFSLDNNDFASDNYTFFLDYDDFTTSNYPSSSDSKLLPFNEPTLPGGSLFSNGGHAGPSLGFSFYLGWLTFLLEILVVVFHTFVCRNVDKNLSNNENDIATLLT